MCVCVCVCVSFLLLVTFSSDRPVILSCKTSVYLLFGLVNHNQLVLILIIPFSEPQSVGIHPDGSV